MPQFSTVRLLQVLLLSILVGCNVQLGSSESKKDKEKDKQAAAKKKKENEVIPVRVASLRIGSISRSLSGSGTLRGKAEVEVLTRAEGQVIEVLVDKGNQVEKGQILARLDDRLRRVDLDNAKVSHNEALAKQGKARYALTEQDHVIARSRLKLTDSKVALVKSGLAFAETKRALASKRGLPKGSLSQDELEKVQLARDQAEQEVKRAGLTVLQSKLDLKSVELKKTDLQEDLRDAARHVKKANLAVKKSELELDRQSVRAPISGLIYFRELELGQHVAASKVVFKVVDQRWFYLDLQMPEAELSLVSLGQRVLLTAQLLFAPVAGRISQIDPAIDPKTGTVGVRIQVPDRDNLPQGLIGWIPADFLLRRGMFVRARIRVKHHARAKLVKQEALIYEDQQAYVFTVRGNKAVRVAVSLGFSSEDELEIFSKKLAEGAPIVVVGQRTIKDGTKVRTVQ